MPTHSARPFAFLICFLTIFAHLTVRGETVRWGFVARTQGPEAVSVKGAGLVHTAQIEPLDAQGKIAGKDAAAQTSQILDNIEAALGEAGAKLSDTVKLNLYVRDQDAAAEVIQSVNRRFPKNARPAISLVETALPHAGALVAADVVASLSHRDPRPGVTLYPHAALLPAGPRVYISGQASRDTELKAATLAALTRLKENLEFLGLGLSDAVQVKAFLRPMTAAVAVEKDIREFFGPKTPPIVFVEWRNAEPIEIEMIAAGKVSRDDSKRAVVEYVRAPGETASPVFCRIVRVEDPTTIYFSSVYGKDGGDGPAQIREIFASLTSAAQRAGTDLRHLVKATYYVTTDDISAAFTDIRKQIYDPQRPPAASKATVAGTGVAGRLITMDMIAVPAAKSAATP